jgi:spermidine/putrescine transport system permease protein
MSGKKWSPQWLLVVPAVAIIAFFLVVPMGIALYDSFLSPNVYGGVKPPTSIDAYTGFLFERQLDGSRELTFQYLSIFWRSISLAVLTTLICVVIGFPCAWYIVCQQREKKFWLLALVSIPFFINTLIRTYCWVLLLRDTGLVNAFLQYFGITAGPIQFIYNDAAILLGLTYTFLPFMVLPIYATLERLDTRLIEAALDLYGTRLQIFLKVILPLAVPGIMAGCVMVFAPALGSFLAPDMLGGGHHLLIGSLIQNQFTSARNWPFGAALSILVTVPILFVFLVVFRRRTDA